VQSLQEIAHSADHNYVKFSPHLRHRSVFRHLVSLLDQVLTRHSQKSVTPCLLDVGAGDGAFVEPVLARGWRVVALEMSRPSISLLNDRYGANPLFDAVLDEQDDLSVVGDSRFDVILYASVVHHIPDYLSSLDSAVTNHLEPGGSLVTFQDPLWYLSLRRRTFYFSKISYLSWRVLQGNILQGVQNVLRRRRSSYDESNISDMAEYHVVRQGVDQEALIRILEPKFTDVQVVTYWSTHSTFFQWLGERLGARNTFAILATGYKA
jgi:SAM-dependent methyltransferase